MERWVLFSLISMAFAGCTSVIAKMGLAGVSAELGLAVRTCFVFAFVLAFAAWFVPPTEMATLSRHNIVWLALSAFTTAISWIFYYKAIHVGEVSTVVLIDKGSFVVAVILAFLVLGERISWRVVAGCTLIVAGLFVVARK